MRLTNGPLWSDRLFTGQTRDFVDDVTDVKVLEIHDTEMIPTFGSAAIASMLG